MQPHSNADGSRLQIGIDCGGIYDKLLCILTLDEQYYGRLFVIFVGTHLNLDVVLLGYNGRNCTNTQPHSNGDDSRLRMDIDCGGIYDALLC